MKIGKFLKYIDFCVELEILDEQDNIIYNGGIIPFHAAGDTEEECQHFIDDCIADEDFKTAEDTKIALKLFNRKLYNDVNGEAVGIKKYVNEHGVERFILIIYVKGVGK